MKRILLTIIISLALIVPCYADGITKEQAYEMSQIGDMKVALNREINPYETVITKENVQIIIDKIAGIVERYGYSKEEYRVMGYKQGNLFFFMLALKLKHSDRVYEAKAMYVWEDSITVEDTQAITNILWMNSYDYLRLMAPEQLTPEQEAEDKAILYIVKEINTQIPINTLVTKETIETIGNQSAGIIEKAGYSKEEYFIQTLFCPGGHIHYRIKIKPKTQNGSYVIDSKYFFKHEKIKPKKI